MNILYYCWDEYTTFDIIEQMNYLGHTLEIFRFPIKDKLHDTDFSATLSNKLNVNHYDCIFTFNYFPVISKIAQAHAIKYISWIFDSPLFTLYSSTIYNSCNYVFCFDRQEALRLQSYGATQVFHMPLAVNTHKGLQFNLTTTPDYTYDITFLGNLYNDQYNFYDQIQTMPDYYRGFFDGIINAQMNIYGYDFASNIITEAFSPILKSFVQFNLDDELFITDTDFFIQMIQKKTTVTERVALLKLITDCGYPLTHFGSKSDVSLNNVDYKGYADYDKEMPGIFHNSKINLNITLRCIQSGIPLRCLDIMNYGGFLLSNYQPELAEYFEDGKDLVLYESYTDLIHKIDYYLNHDEEREEIARNGQRKVQEHFSYPKMLQEIFRMAELN